MFLIEVIINFYYSGGEFFKGPTFVPPSEVPNTPGRLFYKQEVFYTLLEEVHPIASISGRCAVLEHAEYISCELIIYCYEQPESLKTFYRSADRSN